MKFEIYCDRGDGKLANDGCWGGENNVCDTIESAMDAAEHLAQNYRECDWVVVADGSEVLRIERTSSKLAATWDEDLKSYVCGEWTSVDGDNWVNEDGRPAVCDLFRYSSIELFGGPRNGMIVG